MINIYFLVEGNTEERFITSKFFKSMVLSRNPKIDLNNQEEYNINIINYNGTTKMSAFKNDILSISKYVDIIVPIFDVYGNPFNIKQDTTNKEKNYNEFHKYMESITNNKNNKARIISYLSFQEIETLLFSDVKMLNFQIAKSSSKNIPIKDEKWFDIERDIGHPSLKIKDALSHSYYNKPVFFKETIESIAIDTIFKKCEYFSKMVDKLILAIEEIKQSKENHTNPIKII